MSNDSNQRKPANRSPRPSRKPNGDDEGNVAILEGRAEDLRIRPAGDLLTVSVGPVTEGPEARESLRRMMAPGD